jgi:hypothetical protein
MHHYEAHWQTTLSAIAAFGAVVWTGGLIVLQLRRGPEIYGFSKTPLGQAYEQRSSMIQAGMACAALRNPFTSTVTVVGI